MSYAQFGYAAFTPSTQLMVGTGGTAPTPVASSPCCGGDSSGGRPSSSSAEPPVLPATYDSRLLTTYHHPRLYEHHQPTYANFAGVETSPFYPTLSTAYGMKDAGDPWRGIAPSASYYYDPSLAAYGYGGLDFNGARRKNVTRDSTSTLKAWLNEHRKNPYPTKGEKIMLAIITKMTLTQVSTWFANARRRLKKENKMTWSPRNRCEDDDLDDRDEDATQRMKDGDGKRSEKDHDGERRREDHHHHHGRQSSGSDDGKMDFVDVDDDCKSCASTSTDGHVITNSSDKENNSLLRPHHRVPSPVSDASLGSEDSETSQNNHPTELPQSQQQQKPRIWSIVDTATSGGPSSSGGALSPLQRAAYLSPYPKPPASWYASALGNHLNFPLSAVYPESSSAAVSSLNRLRTAAAAFPTATPGETLALRKTSPSPPPSMFSLATSKEQRSPPTSSSSAAAIAAMAGGAAGGVINSGPSAGRVIS